MINNWKKLPMDLVNKIMSFAPIESPAMTAWKTATIREVSTNELWCKVDGEIKLNEDYNPTWFLTDLDAEYYLFLLSQTET
tara:strand:+ start:82 stop:324 length:243 start_codon:yes stop_codon:yes gene_type:complete